MRRRSQVRVGQVLWWFLVVSALGAFAVLWGGKLLLWVLKEGPRWLVGTGELEPEDAILISGFRTTLVQALVGVGAVIALWFTWRNYKLAHRGQVTDRFIKALERLGSDEMYIRCGAVIALEQIVQDAPDQAPHATQLLAAFIRLRVPQRQQQGEPASFIEWRQSSIKWRRLPARPDEDVQASLTAMTRPASRRHASATLHVDLRGRHLAGAHFGGADLTGAWLSRADLTGAYFGVADLTDAWLNESILADAWLSRADLTRTHFGGADLTGAWLNEADLTLAEGLTVDQVVAARPDRTTRLPAAIAADSAVPARIAEVEAEAEAEAEAYRQQRAGLLARQE